MKRLLFALSFLPSFVYAAGNQVGLTVSSGTFQNISTYNNNDGAQRQAIVIGDVTSSTTLTVDSIKGIPVYISTGTSSIGTVTISTGGVNVTGTVAATQSGAWTVNVATGGVNVSGTVAATQSGTWTTQPGNTPNTQDWRVTMGTASVTNAGTFAVQAAQSGSWALSQPTTAAMQIQGPAGILTGVGYQTSGGSVPVNVLNTVSVTGSLSANSVNITTAAFNTAIPGQGVIIGGVNAAGLFHTFAVDESSRIQVTGSFSATSVNITTAAYDTAFPAAGSAIGYTNSSGLFQSPLVDASSRTIVVISTGGVNATQGGTWTVQPGNTANTTPWIVQVATGGVNVTGSVSATQSGTWAVNIATGGVTVAQGPVGVQDWRVTMSTAVVTPRVLVSSNTAVPTATADAGQVQAMGDAYGRIVTVAGVPTSITVSTQPAAITGTGYTVLVASPSSTIFTHMCGCSVINTSATDTYVTIYPSGNTTTSNFFRIGAPKANFNSGIWPGCDKPFLSTTAGGVQVTVQAAASVSSLLVQCKYYQSTIP